MFPFCMRRATTRILTLLAAFSVGGSVIAGCSRNDAAPAPAKTSTVPVSVAQAVKKTVALRLQAIGTVEPLNTVAIKARVDSQITEVHFHDGQELTRGYARADPGGRRV